MTTVRSADPRLPFLLARWVDARLQHCGTPHSVLAQWFGIDLLDREALESPPRGAAGDGDWRRPAARLVYLGAGPPDVADPDVVHRRAASHDAIAVVRSRWLPATRPGRPSVRRGAPSSGPMFVARRRARVVEVRCPEGSAALARFDAAPHVATDAAG